MTGIELAGALMKPLYYLWQLARGLLPKRNDDTFRVPKRTLILLADTHPFALRWSSAAGPDGSDIGIFLVLSFRATNIVSCAVRPSDVRVNWPRNIEIIHKTITTEGDDGAHSDRNMIPPRHIGDVSISLLVRPCWAKVGDDLPIHIGVVDQFNNQHRLKLRCSFVGPKLSE
jgi:hypothetical protein